MIRAAFAVLIAAVLAPGAVAQQPTRGPARPAAHPQPARLPARRAPARPASRRPPPRRHALAPSAPAAAPVWAIDKAASRLSFQASSGGQQIDGVFKTWDAQVAFDPKNLQGSRVVISISTASAITGDPIRDQALPGPNWFWSRRYPKALFISHSITPAGPGHFQAVGDLSLRGVRRRIAAPFTVSIDQDAGTIQGEVLIDRTQFGVGRGPSAENVAPLIKVNVRLSGKPGH